MVDIPANSSTTASLGVGDSTVNTLETVGDRDWFRLDLDRGESVTITLNSITLADPYLRIRDSAGNILYENDDIQLGQILDSQISFTANYSGTYYIEVGSWNDGYAGDYSLSVGTYTPPPFWDNDEIAEQLVSGYWAGDTHSFNAGQGDTITVNITALTAAGQNLAREALDLWSDIIGIEFAEVASGGQITFDDTEEGAFSDGTWSNGVISSTHVNVSTDWLADYGTGLNSYSFQTYIHEIGHALGLGHAGNYNETARYPYDVLFENDSWASTVMSYFDQNENTYFLEQGFTVNFLGTPMVADIIAVGELYGLSTTTRTGNTTYGFNSNAGRAVYDATQYPNLSYTVFDSGGIDTLDYSGFGNNQRIDLNPEEFSSVGSRRGNVSIARGVTIENAIGGSGNDTIIGNAANNRLDGRGGNDRFNGNGGNDVIDGGAGSDTMEGGAGDDTFQGTAASLNGDTITDLSGGDRIVITNASLASFSFSLSGNTLTYTGGSLTLGAAIAGALVASAAQGGGVQLAIAQDSTDGTEGDDVLKGGSGDDELNGFGGNDVLIGFGGDDRLSGDAGHDQLEGGAGADLLVGGTGNDVYVVTDADDQVVERAGEGSDVVSASVTYVLDNNVEDLRLTGSSSIRGFGNAEDNRITGNSDSNRLYGRDGDDRLFGAGGNDRLYGEAGIDRLYGGAGDDIYIVHDATDYAYESAGEGADRVYSAISHVLRSNVEELRLQGTAAINGYGGADANLIVGNSAANKLNGWGGDDKLYGEGGNDRLYGTDGDDRLFGDLGNDRLDGGAGYDRMYGGSGNDIYIVRDSTDFAYEQAGEGTDTVYSYDTHILRDNVETLRLSGSAAINGWGNAAADTIVGNGAANRLIGQGGDDRLFGGHGNDRLYGDDGDDRLDGGRGNDLLFGGSGGDDFLFRGGDFASATPAGADRIADFSRAEGDRLHLSSVDANGAAGGNQAFAFIGTGDFTGTAGELRYEQLSGNTYVSGDTNGDGVADFMIRLDGLHTLESGDFIL